MRIFILTDDLSGQGPVHLNMMWPQINVLSECFDTRIIPQPKAAFQQVRGRFAGLKQRADVRRHSARIREWVLRELDPDGPNALIVWTGGAQRIVWSNALEPIWPRFSDRILYVNDTLQPSHMAKRDFQRFDRILFTCGDQANDFEAQTGVPTRLFAAHTDVLRYHSTQDFRPVDVIHVGRRQPSLHDPLFRHFNRPESERLFLDFVTRNQMEQTHKEEFGLLMAMYGRSRVATCYQAGYLDRFEGRSPLLARWVHAWAAGCTIIGTRPTGRGVEPLVDWPESILDIPEEPGDAIAYVERVLEDGEGQARRRKRNVIEALRRHDTRYRLRDLAVDLGWPVPSALEKGLADLQATISRIEGGLTEIPDRAARGHLSS